MVHSPAIACALIYWCFSVKNYQTVLFPLINVHIFHRGIASECIETRQGNKLRTEEAFQHQGWPDKYLFLSVTAHQQKMNDSAKIIDFSSCRYKYIKGWSKTMSWVNWENILTRETYILYSAYCHKVETLIVVKFCDIYSASFMVSKFRSAGNKLMNRYCSNIINSTYMRWYFLLIFQTHLQKHIFKNIASCTREISSLRVYSELRYVYFIFYRPI